jgi:hypothetical protein
VDAGAAAPDTSSGPAPDAAVITPAADAATPSPAVDAPAGADAVPARLAKSDGCAIGGAGSPTPGTGLFLLSTLGSLALAVARRARR